MNTKENHSLQTTYSNIKTMFFYKQYVFDIIRS